MPWSPTSTMTVLALEVQLVQRGRASRRASGRSSSPRRRTARACGRGPRRALVGLQPVVDAPVAAASPARGRASRGRRTGRGRRAAGSTARAARRCRPRARTAASRAAELERSDGGREHARREGAGRVLPVAAVGEVVPTRTRFSTSLASSGASQWRASRLGHARRRRGAADLTAGAREAVEAAPEAARRRGEAEERVVGHVCGPAAGAAGALVRSEWSGVCERRPAGRDEQPAPVVPAAERELAPPGEDRVAGRDGGIASG